MRLTDQFYSNREIYEKLTDKIDGLSKELTETQRVVKKYNGLREWVGNVDAKLETVCVTVAAMESEGRGKNKLASGVSWAIGIAGAIVGIAGGILAIASRL